MYTQNSSGIPQIKLRKKVTFRKLFDCVSKSALLQSSLQKKSFARFNIAFPLIISGFHFAQIGKWYRKNFQVAPMGLKKHYKIMAPLGADCW
jgi:hypothetical protein